MKMLITWLADMVFVFAACYCLWVGKVEIGLLFMILDQLCRVRQAIERVTK